MDGRLMRRGSQYRTLLQALSGAARLFAMPIASAGASIILGDRKDATRTASSFQGDPTALEAFVNHVHLDDLLGGLPLSTDGAREALVALGRALAEVYAERARPFLGGRELIFYLGGETRLASDSTSSGEARRRGRGLTMRTSSNRSGVRSFVSSRHRWVPGMAEVALCNRRHRRPDV